MDNNLPWTLVFIGAFIAIVIEILGIPVLPFAIGVYLPIHLNACIMVGGIVRLVFDKKFASDIAFMALIAATAFLSMQGICTSPQTGSHVRPR